MEGRTSSSEVAVGILVARGLDALDFDKRIALVMHDLEGIGVPEIAAYGTGQAFMAHRASAIR